MKLLIFSQTKTRRRFLVIASVSFTLLLVSVTTANAQLGLQKASKIVNSARGVTSTLEPYLGKQGDGIQSTLTDADSYLWQASQYWSRLSSFYYNLIGANLEGILGDIQGISGALGIPDPFAIRSQGEWNEQIRGTFSTSQAKASTIDRALATGIASIVLSKDGQSLTAEQQQQVATVVQQSGQAAQQSATAAQQAQTRNVTQDILKDVAVQQAIIAQQQTNQAQISQQMSGQLTGLQLQGAAGNVMLSDISGTLDAQELQRQVAQQASNLSEAQTAAQIFIPGINFSN